MTHFESEHTGKNVLLYANRQILLKDLCGFFPVRTLERPRLECIIKGMEIRLLKIDAVMEQVI